MALLLALTFGPHPLANPASAEPVILQITDCGWGMSYPQSCRLYFRMWGSGKFEYEAEPQYDAKLKKLAWKTKASHLNRTKVQEIIGLISSPDFLEAKDNYPRLFDFVDAAMALQIKTEYGGVKKEIEIRNYMPQHERAKSYYPAALIKLIEIVKEVRPKDIGE
jgi:hypothetical protein